VEQIWGRTLRRLEIVVERFMPPALGEEAVFRHVQGEAHHAHAAVRHFHGAAHFLHAVGV